MSKTTDNGPSLFEQHAEKAVRSANAEVRSAGEGTRQAGEGTRMRLKDFVENPDNPQTVSDEAFDRLVEKLKRVPIGLTASRIAYVTDHSAGRYVVLSGNKRLRALKRIHGEDFEAPAEWFQDITPMTEEQRREYIVTANVNEGEWDVDKLLAQYDKGELGNLMDASDIDDLVQSVQDEEEEKDGMTDVDAVPDVPEDPKSRRGCVYQIGQHRLMCGDSTKPEDVARLMGGETADLLVTDPPYNVGYVGGTKDKLTIANDSMDNDSFIKFLSSAFSAAAKNMKPGAAFYIWHAQWGGRASFFSMAVASAGLLEKQTLIWVKSSIVLGRQDYQWIHEPCLYGWKGGAAHYFIDRRDLTTVTEDRRDIKKMKLKELRQYCEELLARGQEAVSVLREEKPTRSEDHPTMKPVRLFADHLRNSSRKDGVVLDIFGGSGTATIAAEQLNRRCRTMELDPKYCDVIRRRWAEFVHGEGCDWEKLTPEVKS